MSRDARKSKIDNDRESKQIRRILTALAQASGPAPLNYISLHAKVEEPLRILMRMEDMDLVHRSTPSTWSCSRDPCYEMAPAGRERLDRAP